MPRIPTVASAVLAMPIAYYAGAGGQLLAVLGAMVLVAVWRLVEQALPSHRRSAASLVRDLAAGTFVQGYVTFLATFTVVLTAADGGQWWTLAFIIIAVAADIACPYGFGLAFGKHKMAPVISPEEEDVGGLRRRRRREPRGGRCCCRPSCSATRGGSGWCSRQRSSSRRPWATSSSRS